MSEAPAVSIKLVSVGDGAVGKTTLLIKYATGEFREKYIPTVFENSTVTVVVDGKRVQMSLWDTAGQEEYDRLRPLSYPGTNVFILCFSLVDRRSAENVVSKWWPELRHHASDTPIILVGTKVDLRQDQNYLTANKIKPISTQEGETLRSQIKAVRYIECSARTDQEVGEVFNSAIRVVLSGTKPGKTKKKDKGCIVL